MKHHYYVSPVSHDRVWTVYKRTDPGNGAYTYMKVAEFGDPVWGLRDANQFAALRNGEGEDR